jgi:hypothetical protein
MAERPRAGNLELGHQEAGLHATRDVLDRTGRLDEHELGQLGWRLAASGPRCDRAREQRHQCGGQRGGAPRAAYGTAVTL